MASRSVNKVILVGHLGRDAETKFTPSGAAATRFSVATSRRWKDQQTNDWKEETNWTNVVLWRQENLANYLTKGKQIYVEGRIQTRSYDDKDGKKVYATEVVADEVILLGGRGDGAFEGGSAAGATGAGGGGGGRGGTSSRGKSTGGGMDDDPGPMGISDDDVPF
jgi:single-strand DNA-binding protein